MLLAARALTGVAVVKLLWMVLAVALGSPATPVEPEGLAFGVYPTALLATAFAASGGFLVWASPGDTRGWWLGGTLLLVGVAFGDAVLLRRTLTGLEASVTPALAADAFLPCFLWSFLRDFPRLETAERDRVAAWFVRISAAVGATLVAANLFFQVGAGTVSLALMPYLARRSDSAYPLLVMGLTAAGLPYLLWKSQRARVSERRRVQIFAAGLLAAAGPILLDILLSSISPAYEAFSVHPDAFDVRMLLLFSTLALVPLVTAYSVFVDRVIDVRVVLRAALQYTLAKYTLFALVSVPFVLLAAYVFEHRDKPLTNLFVGPRFAFSLTLMAAGVAALGQRSRWLRAIDTRFFRDESDATVLIASLAEHARAAVGELELSRIVRRDVAEGLHVEHAVLLVADAAGAAFKDPGGLLQPLGHASGIALLLSGDTAPFDVSPAPDNPVFTRLPPQERRWLAQGGFEVLVPIHKSRSVLAAVLALGPKRSGQRFSAADHRVLAAIAASLTLAIENQRLRSSPSGEDEEPAEECLTCGTLYPSGSAECRCGGGLARAPVPHVLRNAFRFERRLGAGGMGVVYQARDLALTRQVAIKTLPRLSPERAERLRHEAQTMARLAHPNLATIHGAETWRGTPLLVVELLTGGTLADRLRTGPLSLADARDVGIALADVLRHIHGEDMVHCDIKPSNIGFTGTGTLKLLDFGLARMLADDVVSTVDDQDVSLANLATTHSPSGPPRSHARRGRFMGTPLYMAPEAIEGRNPTPLFDLWGAGVVLYESLAGHHPFAGGTTTDVLSRIIRGQYVGFSELKARLPLGWVDLLQRVLSPEPEDRVATATDLKMRLLSLQPLAAPG